MLRLLLTLPATAGLLIILASATAPAAPIPEAKQAPLYFPTKVGATWVYQEGEKEFTETVSKVEQLAWAAVVSVSRSWDGGTTADYQRVAVSAKGLALVGLYGTKFDPPVWLLELPPRAGLEWKTERASDTGPYYDVRVIRREETVETPAGKFVAVPVARRTTLDGRQTGVQWFAPGVGLVRSEYGKETKVLKKFTPAKD